MGIEDLGQKAGEFVREHSDKAKEALSSEEAEGLSDKVLDGAADLAHKVTGGKFDDKVEDIRATLDEKFGTE